MDTMKYKLSEICIKESGKILYRIRALKDFTLKYTSPSTA